MSVATPPGGPGRPSAARLPVRAGSRRPTLLVLALLLVLVGALGSALIAYRSGNRTDVLVAARPISPGHRVTAGDFAVARVAVDTGSVVASADVDTLLGAYATVGVPAGTLVNRQMFRSAGVLPDGSVVVGLSLAVPQHPSPAPAVGDVVRVYLAPTGSQGSGAAATAGGAAGGTGSGGGAGSGAGAASGRTLVPAARVTAVDVSAGSGALTLSVLVSTGDAALLVPLAAQSQVGVGTLPADTRPAVDFAP